MRSRPWTRVVSTLWAAAVAIGAAATAALPAAAQENEPLVLRAGTDQALQVLNPWNSVTVADFEAFQIQYDQLVNFGVETEPVPGFAESWTVSDDELTWTFNIRDGMLWSDGQPATCEDARWTYQTIIDATANEETLGEGYLEPYLVNAGVKSATCTDADTLVVETEFPNTLLTQAYVPILPAHIWSKLSDAAAISAFANDPPVVGTGPYQAVEWEPGNFIRFVRNENYWGEKPAVEEVILQHFDSADTMVQALRRGEIDYARGIQPDQFTALASEPGIATVESASNGFTEIAFNTYSRSVDGGPPGVIPGGGASTPALQDPAFRDALGWAVDNDVLVERVLGGYGEPGTTIVPPFHTRWHTEPTNPRRFDIDEAKRRLDAAGYALDAEGRRLDKDGNPITLRLTWPDSEAENATAAEFIAEWWRQLGIEVNAQVTEEGKLIDDEISPEGGGTADYDAVIWGWVGDPDPTSLLNILTSDQIGNLNDAQYENARYDELFELQRAEPDEANRKGYMQEMSDLIYDEAPYLVLYYDSGLDAYRTDKIAGWRNQPSEGGTPIFNYGYLGYIPLISAAAASPSPEASAAPPASAAASPEPGPTTPAAADNTGLLVAGVALVGVVVVGGIVVLRRRSGGQAAEEEEE